MNSRSGATKKQRETHLLLAFLAISRLPAQILDAEREAPDFILGFEGRKIGLEVMEIFISDDGGAIAPRARESIAARIATQARRRYEELGGKPVHVTIGLSLGAEVRDLNRSETADSLAKFLLALDPPLNQLVAWRPAHENDPLPPEVHYLNILAVPSWNMAHWYIPQSGWVAPLTEGVLQANIDDKARKLGQYRLAVPEVWLLLAIEGWSASQLFDRASDIEVKAIRTPFDRTYFVSAFDGMFLPLGSPHDA
jgi:hypothetical protein